MGQVVTGIREEQEQQVLLFMAGSLLYSEEYEEYEVGRRRWSKDREKKVCRKMKYWDGEVESMDHRFDVKVCICS